MKKSKVQNKHVPKKVKLSDKTRQLNFEMQIAVLSTPKTW